MISIYLKEGLVMASSRLSTNTLFSNSENQFQKCIFKTHNNIGISVNGNALYDYENLIDSFILTNNHDLLTVTSLAYKFNDFLKELDLQSEICIHIGGYEKYNGQQNLKVYKICLPEGKIEQLNTKTQTNTISGAAWAGEENVLNELVKPLFTIDLKGNTNKLREYSMPWEMFSLEEAIDFSYLSIKNSSNIKKTLYNSAVEEAPIDVLVITPKSSEWLSFNNPNEKANMLVHTC
jgi:hypothetical protein